MYESAFLSDEDAIRFIAARLDSSRRSFTLELHQWDSFIRHMNGKLGQRITLLLDEVDSV